MIRTQTSLTDEQMRRLRADAARRGISLAAVIRDAVDGRVPADDRQEHKRRALDIVGRYDSGHGNISETCDLVQRRLGAEAAIGFLQRLVPLPELIRVERETHQSATARFVGSPSRSTSLWTW